MNEQTLENLYQYLTMPTLAAMSKDIIECQTKHDADAKTALKSISEFVAGPYCSNDNRQEYYNRMTTR